MSRVNLLSQKLRFARERSRRIRAWVTVVTLTSLLAAVPVTISAVQSARASSIESQIAPVLDHLGKSRQILKHHEQRSILLSTQIARAESLRSKRPWSDLLELIARDLPDQVWLTAVKSHEGKREGESSPSGPPTSRDVEAEVIRINGPEGLEIRGFATSHEWIYEWISRLKNTSAFVNVELIEAASEPIHQGEAVRFVLECDW